MDASEAQELQEQHEHAAGEPSLRPVSFTISVLAVFVAIVTVLGHRSHTQAVLYQNKATDDWNLYQAHKIRQYDTQLITDLLTTLPIRDQAAANKITDGYKSHLQKWNQDLVDAQNTAKEDEEKVHHAEHRADRFDLGEALLEIGLVITSITLLTRQRSYWYMGMLFGIAGMVAAALGFLHFG
ncbi:MAG: DUF4337 domain-containing protein [Acidobacteriaceae bacterium]|jgi:hypothetical protein